MHIGEKIKRLRVSKMMTQAELAGDHITRNMLCCIERGSALPSLPTALYIAERLNVPVGYLLSEEADDLSYRKMAAMPNIRRALLAGDDAGCIALLDAVFGENGDDEISLIRAECEYRLAKFSFDNGHLRMAANGFDRALIAARHTVYDTEWMRRRSAVYFRFLTEISPSITSDLLEEAEINTARATGDDFCSYMMARDALDRQRDGELEDYLSNNRGSPYAARLSALRQMRRGELAEALDSYEKLLSRDDLPVGVLMYEIFGDMELCCRQNDDYKRAFAFSSSRIGLLERLLQEE